MYAGSCFQYAWCLLSRAAAKALPLPSLRVEGLRF